MGTVTDASCGAGFGRQEMRVEACTTMWFAERTLHVLARIFDHLSIEELVHGDALEFGGRAFGFQEGGDLGGPVI